jgi:hypothetical protein
MSRSKGEAVPRSRRRASVQAVCLVGHYSLLFNSSCQSLMLGAEEACCNPPEVEDFLAQTQRCNGVNRESRVRIPPRTSKFLER